MSGANSSNVTDTPGGLQNDSKTDNYDETYFWQDHGPFADTLVVLLVICGLLLIYDIILLLTCISPEARSRSASWYLYHMVGLSVINGVLVIPLENTANVCKFSLFLTNIISCVRGMNMILINVEIMATVLAPQALWERYRKCRFYISIGFIWMCNIAIMSGIHSVGSIRYGYYENDCYIYGSVELIILHILKNWLPGFVLICFTIAAFVTYNRLRRNGFYNQIAGSSGEIVQRREWFICMIVLNSLYVVVDILFYEMQLLIVNQLETEVAILALANLVLFVMPSAMLALKDVRMALKKGAISVWTHMCKRPDRPPRSPTESGQNIILNMDTINDQAL